MENLDLLLKYSALLFFAAASFSYLAGLPISDKTRKIRGFAHGTFLIGLLVLSWNCFREYDGRVWADSAGQLLTLFVGICGLVAIFRLKIYASGAFFAPFCSLLLMLQHFFSTEPSSSQPSHSLQNVLAGFHVLLAVLGEALIIVGFALAASYLRRRRQLRQKNFAEIRTARFSLDHIERMFNHIIWAAFIFISLSLISGALYTQLFLPQISLGLMLKIIWGLAVWLTTLVMIFCQRLFSWPFRKTAYLSGASLLLLALAFFGLMFSRAGGGL